MSASPIDLAYYLAAQGRRAEAVAILEQGGPECWHELGLWNLRGDMIARDLARSRHSFGVAAKLGHDQARRIHYALLGTGVGGAADWPRAVALLAEHAETNADAAEEIVVLNQMNLDQRGRPKNLPPFDQLSEAPDARLFKAFMTETECRYLIGRAEPMLQPSVIVDPTTGRMRPDPMRTSENAMFPWVVETPVIQAINERMAIASGTAAANGEPLQVLSYRPGQEYKPHLDALPGTANQRIWTMLVYLNDDYQGGETLFVQSGLRVKGATGDALLFRNADASGRADPASQHAGLPVEAGRKLLASRWIHQDRFGPI